MNTSVHTTESNGTSADWSAVPVRDHFVQFYASDDALLTSLVGFIGTGLQNGESAVVIGTPEHRRTLEDHLRALRLDVSDLSASHRYQAFDAEKTLAEFMFGRLPDQRRFNEAMGGVLWRAARDGRRVRAFGEMVAILWARGNREGALRLEQLWNDLARSHAFALFCAYPRHCLEGPASEVRLGEICSHHTRVIPGEARHSAA